MEEGLPGTCAARAILAALAGSREREGRVLCYPAAQIAVTDLLP